MFFLVSFVTKAQNVTELQYLLSQPELSSKERIGILYTLSRELTYVDHIKSLEYAEEALHLATELKDEEGIAYSYRILASIYAINDNYFMSMEYIHKALDIFERLESDEGIANCYISMGHIFRNLENRNQEIYFHKKSFEIFKELGITERIAVSAHNLGESYFNNTENAKAEKLTRLSIKLNDSIQNLPVLSSSYKVMGLIKEKESQLDSAKVYFEKVLNISEALGDNSQKVATVTAMMHLAEMARLEKKYIIQHDYLKQIESFCERFNLKKSLLDVYQRLQKYHLEQGELEKVGLYLDAFNELSKTVHDIQLKDRNRLTESMTSIHILNATAEALEKENAAQASTIFFRNIGLALMIILLLVLFMAFRKNALINEELSKQNDLIMRQKSELQELNATKNKFFSIVAHDLRSPLTSLKSFGTVLTEHLDHFSKEEIMNMGEQLDATLDNTLKMTDNLILWAKCQMNMLKDQQELVNIKEVVNNVTDIFKGIADDKGISLSSSVEGEPSFMGDKNQIAFVIRNLVNNAIKFTPRNGAVNINVNQIGDLIKIVVSDTGIGMPLNLSEQLFSIQKPHGSLGTEGEKGSGLGLVLSSEFIKRNQGEISVDSAEEKGTSITVSFFRKKLVA